MRPFLIIASGFGSGFARTAPGTAGSVAAVLAWGVSAYFFQPDLAARAIALALLFAVGVYATSKVILDSRLAHRSGSKGMKDPGWVVIDEWAGMWCTLLFTDTVSFWSLTVGFILFRIFDITKPWPCSALERAPGAWGIMLDDLMAGVFALCVLEALAAVTGL